MKQSGHSGKPHFRHGLTVKKIKENLKTIAAIVNSLSPQQKSNLYLRATYFLHKKFGPKIFTLLFLGGFFFQKLLTLPDLEDIILSTFPSLKRFHGTLK